MIVNKVSHVFVTCAKKLSNYHLYSGNGLFCNKYFAINTRKMSYSIIERGSQNSIDYRLFIRKYNFIYLVNGYLHTNSIYR